MINHHPADDLLLALAAGHLDGGQSLLVSVHLEACAPCRSRLHLLQALGGELLVASEPHPLARDALDTAFARIDAPPIPAPERLAPTAPFPALPGGTTWPASLRRVAVTPWRRAGPGVRWSRVALPYASPGTLFLLRIAPGNSLPRHTHRGVEHTQVLCGAFDDGRATFAAGDFDTADEDVHHQPVVHASGECVCLAYVGGNLRFDGWLASLLGRAIGM
jgi:putative transcriptional regulator